MKATMVRRLMPLAVLLFGCGDGAGPDDGQFEFTVTGQNINRTVTGDAFYVLGEADGVESLSIVLSTGEDGFVLSRARMTRPPAGTYDIKTGIDAGPDDFSMAGFFREGSSLSHLCESGSTVEGSGPVFGSVTITQSGEDLTGTFTATVGCLDYSTGNVANATVTGAFDAVEIEPGDVE